MALQEKGPLHKEDVQDLSSLEAAATRATYIESETLSELSAEHRAYLLRRHGTLELDPIPDCSDADPYNWPKWKKVINLLLVAFHALMTTFIASAIIPAYANIAEDLGVSIAQASYLTALMIAIFGGGPLLWKPLSKRYGRRPIFLFSLVTSLVCNIGCAKCTTYSSLAACRALVAFFICPAAAIGSGVVTETFFKHERAKYMGVWTLMLTLGVPLSPFLFGFVAVRVDYHWIYYILAITNAVQLILYIFLGPETRYIRQGVSHNTSTFRQEYIQFRRIDPTPISPWEFISPLGLFADVKVLIPAVAYSMIFLFGSVLTSVEIPQLFGEKFHFNDQQLGLQFIGLIVGSILGEQIGGRASDWWMNRRTKKTGHVPKPEYRLWLNYIGAVLTVIGVVVFLVRLEQAPELHWNVTPIIGAAIAAGGTQIVTTVLITYAVDSHSGDASEVGVFITFVRQMWAFIGPFWFPYMFENVGLIGSAGITAALLISVGLVPIMILHFVYAKK